MLEKQEKRYRRHKKIRAKVFGTADKPRLCVFRSEKHIYTQLIDDEKAKTIVEASDLELKEDKSSFRPFAAAREFKKNRGTKIEKAKEGEESKPSSSPVAKAREVGKLIAKKAEDLKIERVVFDRGGYKYHGRVKAVAEGAREGGLKF
jgi:large subunit ribosomal protein L18